VAQLVPPEGLPNAVGLNSASFTGARLIGPGLAGLLIAGVGPGWVFIINGLSFAATIVALVAMRANELLPMPRVEHKKGQVREGLTYVRGRPDILRLDDPLADGPVQRRCPVGEDHALRLLGDPEDLPQRGFPLRNLADAVFQQRPHPLLPGHAADLIRVFPPDDRLPDFVGH